MADLRNAVQRAEWIRAWKQEASPERAARMFRHAVEDLAPYAREDAGDLAARDAVAEIRRELNSLVEG